MKTKEMRVGDYYIDKESKELCKITPADLINLNYIEEDDDLYIPIPLTREVFLCIESKIEGYCFKDKIDLYILDMLFAFNRDCKSIYELDTYSFENIHYLHQLQNLCYIMTGMELPIDENRLKEYVKTIEL